MAKLNSGTRIYGNLAIDTWANIGTIVQAATINAATIGNSGATLTGTLSTAAQTSVTSVGTLTGLTVTGTTALAGTTASTLNATAGNVTTLYATNFSSGNIYFTGTTNGTVSTANVGLYDSVSATTTNSTFYPSLADKTTGNSGSFTAASLVFNPSTGNLVLAGTTATTSTTTGVLVIGGGIGVGGQGIFGGNLTVGNMNQARANLLVFGGNLNAGVGSSIALAEFYATNTNGSYLRILNNRHAQGADWTSANTRIQQRIDVTDQGYIEFNPVGATYGVAIGSGTTEIMRLASSGNVVINGTTASTSTTTGVLVIKGGAGVAGQVTAGNIMTTSGVFWANGAAYSSGSGGGGITYTTSTTAPVSPTVGSFWYEPTSDVKYQYINDGTSSSWVDQSFPTSFGNLTVANTLTVNGSIVGTTTNANYASAANISLYDSFTATTTNATFYPQLVDKTSGNGAGYTASTLTFNPSTGALGTTSLTASGLINTTGNITIGNASDQVLLAGGYTGAISALFLGTPTVGGGRFGISYDRSSGITSFLGNTNGFQTTTGTINNNNNAWTLNGALTASTVSAGTIGNTGATLTGTISTAAQTNITSVGTLTSLAVSGSATMSATLPVFAGAIFTTGVNLDPGGFNLSTYGGGSAGSGRSIIGWNRSAGSGEMSFINNPDGGSPGGFIFYNWANTQNNTTNTVFNVAGTGLVTTYGNVVPSANVTYNLGSSTAWWSTVYGKAVQAQYADLAEHYAADDVYPPGTVVVFGGSAEITVSEVSHDHRVAGVISTDPAYLMNAANPGLPVALTGRVPCQVQGPVSKGDCLVNISVGTAGRLDPALHQHGCIIGKSLNTITDDSIQTIEIAVGRY